MPDEKSQAFATRLPADEAATIEQALVETDRSKAELLRRALRYYRRRNPDDIAAFYPEGSVERMLAEDVR